MESKTTTNVYGTIRKKYKCHFCGGIVEYQETIDEYYPYDLYACKSCDKKYNVVYGGQPEVTIIIKLDVYPERFVSGLT